MPQKKPYRELLREMQSLGPEQKWTEKLREKYQGSLRKEIHEQLGTPDILRDPRNPHSTPIDEYPIDSGKRLIHLYYVFDKDGREVLNGCKIFKRAPRPP